MGRACTVSTAKLSHGDGKGRLARNVTSVGEQPEDGGGPYPIIMIQFGKAGMPWFNGCLRRRRSRQSCGHVRTNFGNNYAEPVTAKDVTTLTGPVPKDE